MVKVSSEKIATGFIEKLIKDIGLKAEVSVEDTKDELMVNITGDNLGALIGFHGETLESLQLLTSLFLNKTRGEKEEWKRVTVDIGNWRKERSGALVNQIEGSVNELQQHDLERLTLPSMSASQRREVHVIVSEKFPGFGTESEGEEPNRRIVLFKKS